MTQLAHPRRLIPLLACMQAFTPLSIDLYLPALPTIATDLTASEASVQLTVSSYLTGLFIGMLFFGPLSDKYGRRQLLLGGIALYILACLGCALAESVGSLFYWRFTQAIGGAAASILGRAIVRDIFPLREAAGVLSLMHLITMIAALTAPILGSLVLLAGSWRWLFFGLIAFATLLLCLCAWKIPETHHGDSRDSTITAVFRAYASIAIEPRALGYILCMSLCFAGMFAYIAVSPFVFIDFFGLSPSRYAMIFAANISGVILLTTANARLVGRLGPQQMLYAVAALLGAASITLALSAALDINRFWIIVIGLFGFVSCTGTLGANCTASLMNLFPDNAGAAAGLAVATQFGLGALMSTVASRLYDGGPFAMTLTVSLCGFGSVAALYLTTRRKAPGKVQL